jgi:hypothetical protein
VKSGNSLVGATACMMGGILSHHHELGLKAPVGITCIRGFFVLAETYRLTIALRLHAIQMVRDSMHANTIWVVPKQPSLLYMPQ